MCYCGDGDEASFYRSESVGARKAHKCDECGGTIQPGDRYQRITGAWEGVIQMAHICRDCREWGKALAVAQHKACGESCLILGELWRQIAEFCAEHLGYRPDGKAA